MRKRRIAVALVAAAATLTAAAIAFAATGAATATLRAKLDTRQSVPKPKGSTGAGTFTATMKSRKLTWKLTFSKLTAPAVAAHIHVAPRGKANPKPAVSLCGPCRSGQTGTAVVSEAVERKIESGGTYVNVHTKRNPAGEIRGQIAEAE
jgi:Cu/Zn superoxide dismutase